MLVAEPTNPTMPPEIQGDAPISDAHLPMSVAAVCAEMDCGALFDGRRATCPACTSTSSVPLAAILDRDGGRVLPFRKGSR